MLHPALRLLLRLRLRAEVRRAWRSLRSPRGAVMGLGMAVLISASLLPYLSTLFLQRGPRVAATSTLREVIPIVLFAFCAFSLVYTSESSLHFQPAEADFLFSGPFSRRQLLLYRYSITVWNVFWSAFIFSLFLSRQAPYWIPCFIGTFLALLFVQLFNQVVSLAGHTVAARVAGMKWRILILIALLLLLATALSISIESSPQSLAQMAGALRQSPVGLVLLAPFEVFARVMWAPAVFPSLILWAPVAMALDVLLFGAILWLDADYREAALAAGERRYQKIQRLRSGKSLWTSSAATRWHVPAP